MIIDQVFIVYDPHTNEIVTATDSEEFAKSHGLAYDAIPFAQRLNIEKCQNKDCIGYHSSEQPVQNTTEAKGDGKKPCSK